MSLKSDFTPLALVIAVDGPAASGKGTLAARLARHYDLPHLDTGLLYRAAALAAVRAGVDLDEGSKVAGLAALITVDALTDPELTGRAAGEQASRVSAHPEVRRALFDLQRNFAAQAPGAVLDGRDIGTVIAPEAAAKLFVTARPEIRAERRWRQLEARGEAAAFDDILADILARDARDSSRSAAPLRQAEDAVLLDTSDLGIEAAFDAALRIVETARARL